MFLIRTGEIDLQEYLWRELSLKCLKLERRPPFYFISFCPQKRANVRQLNLKNVIVLNPFEGRFWGRLRNGIMWLDEWPSFVGRRWRELRHSLLGAHHVVFLHQSFRLKNDSTLLKEHFKEHFEVEAYQTLIDEKLSPIPLIFSRRLILERYVGEDKRGMVLLDRGLWPSTFGQELFVPLCLWEASEVLALAGRHRIIVMAATGVSSWRYWSWFELALAWLLSGQLGLDLLNWLGANQSRRHSYSQGSLSGTSCHRHSSFKKWSFYFRTFLWRPGWWKKTQGLHFGSGLHDEGGARPQPLHQRAS